MTIYIILWSCFTIATSFSQGFITLAIARIGCGLTEAGAYPASSSILTKWAHINWRGLGSSIISTGGRIGGALAPWLTASVVIAMFSSWRWVGWIYGAAGILVAVGFWIIFRDHPTEHPSTNEAERALLAEGREGQPIKAVPKSFPWKAVLTSKSLWFASLYQTTTNIGWAFLVNSLSTYLKEVKHMSDQVNGQVSSTALFLGIIGLPLGGILTDYWSKRYGIRLGRMLPLVLTRIVAVGAYFAVMAANTPLQMALAFGALAMFVDMGMPAMWAVIQDISGKHQAQLFGWGNMWGNFGAALQPLLFGWVLLNHNPSGDWNNALLMGFCAYVLSGLCALGINSARPVRGA
jgi:MFS family permease